MFIAFKVFAYSFYIPAAAIGIGILIKYAILAAQHRDIIFVAPVFNYLQLIMHRLLVAIGFVLIIIGFAPGTYYFRVNRRERFGIIREGHAGSCHLVAHPIGTLVCKKKGS
jgi:hypothetical protein